jgi:hypothetical protein
MNVSDSLGKVFSIKAGEDYLIVVEKNMTTQIQLIDKKTGMSYKFGRTGEGPGEVLQCVDILPEENQRIGIYDLQKQTLLDFNIDSVVKLKEQCQPDVLMKKVPLFPLSVGRLNAHTYVALGLMSGMKRFVLIDENGEVISMEGDLPEKKLGKINDVVHSFAYWGRLTTNMKKNRIAICTNYAGMMQIYEYRKEKIELIREHRLFLADYTENDGNFAVTAQTRWGYLSIDSNDKYIFALYSGLNQNENPDGSFAVSSVIHVYDWEGNPVCRLASNRKLQMICIDNDFNLYGYDTEKEDIVTANINNILDAH